MLINKKHVKQYALDVSKQSRNGKFTRVSNDFLILIEAILKERIRLYIQTLPSVGKTIK